MVRMLRLKPICDHSGIGYHEKARYARRGSSRFRKAESLQSLARAIRESKIVSTSAKKRMHVVPQHFEGVIGQVLLEAAQSIRTNLTTDNLKRLATIYLGKFGIGISPRVVLDSLYREESESTARFEKMLAELRTAVQANEKVKLGSQELRWRVLQELATISDTSVSDCFKKLKYDIYPRIVIKRFNSDGRLDNRVLHFSLVEARHHRRDLSKEIESLWCAYKNLMNGKHELLSYNPIDNNGFAASAFHVRKQLKSLYATKAELSDFVVKVIKGARQLIAYDIAAQSANSSTAAMLLKPIVPDTEFAA